MPEWLVSLTYPVGDDDIGAFDSAGIVRRGGRADFSHGTPSSQSATFQVEGESEQDVREKVLAVRSYARITDVKRVGGD